MIAKIKEPRISLRYVLVMALYVIVWTLPTSFMPHYFSNIHRVEAQEETQQPSPSRNESSTSSSPKILGQNLENLIRPYVGYITFAIDVSAGIIIGISAIMGLISFFKILRKPVEQQTQDKETIRLRLARGMLLALDFEVGSDILKTILVPSITELTILAVVVGIRIVLSWSLSKEIGRHVDLKAGESRREAALQTTTMSNESNARNYDNDNITSEASAGPNGQRFKQKDEDKPSSSSSSSSKISEE